MRSARILVAAALAGGGWGLGAVVAPQAGAWTDGACPTAEGVTVVVDFAAFGGDVEVRCATGTYDDGMAALRGAGFSVAQPLQTPGFVCRIAELPSSAAESCVSTPPQDRYWAYWRAPRGGSWTYSTFGATTKGTAKPGSVQGWAFSDGSNPTPRVAPPAAPAAPPAPTPTIGAPAAAEPSAGSPAATSPGPAPGAAPGTGRASAAPTSNPSSTAGSNPGSAGASAPTPNPPAPSATVLGASTVPAVAPPAGDPAAGPTADPTATPGDTAQAGAATDSTSGSGATADDTGDDPDRVDLASASSAGVDGAGSDSGSPVPTVLVGAAVLVLGGAAFVVARRRTP